MSALPFFMAILDVFVVPHTRVGSPGGASKRCTGKLHCMQRLYRPKSSPYHEDHFAAAPRDERVASLAVARHDLHQVGRRPRRLQAGLPLPGVRLVTWNTTNPSPSTNNWPSSTGVVTDT
jgi:hypothetical protein